MEAWVPGLLVAGLIWYLAHLYKVHEKERRHKEFRAQFTDAEWEEFARSKAGKEYYK